MIFRQEFLDGIQKGSITVAFRRWRRPSVKSGGTLLTAVGMLHIRDVSLVSLESISDADARRAGYESRETLVEELTERSDGKIYRIELGALEADPRIALRKKRASDSDLQDLILRLERLDSRSNGAPWTRRVLDLVHALRWIHDNIDRFGGDSGNVTIIGQSGGAQKVSTLLTMPSAKGLFHRAVVMSGSALQLIDREQGARVTRELLAELGM